MLSVLDIKQAYHQIPIAQKSQGDLAINTHIGLFIFKRLPNGIYSGPAIFQRIMDNLLYHVPKAVSRLDDILVAGSDEEDHHRTLSLVLERLLAGGFRLNKAKCKFLQNVSLTLVIRLTEKAYILLRINLTPFVMLLDLRMSQP